MNKKEPLMHLVKRTELSKKNVWIIRIVAFLLSILTCAIVSVLLSDKGMGFFFSQFFNGIFGSSRKIWNLLHETAILLIIALAVTPCFKMRFWNIGGEGQILIGALGAAVVIQFLGGKTSDAIVIILSLLSAIVFGVVWAVIPALFKAKWNTNETLFTLMMNYIAVNLVNFFIKSVSTKGTGVLDFDKGVVGELFGGKWIGGEFILNIVLVAIVTAFMAVYLSKSKHGYELTVVGESENTARYIGIKTKAVIIRTLVLCGIICGITGFLLVSVKNHSLNAESTVGGRGFTGVLLSWLAHFNPLAMILTSFLYVFIMRGAVGVGNNARLGASYPSVMTGIFFFFIIATEFFINFKIVFRKKQKSVETSVDKDGATEVEQAEAQTVQEQFVEEKDDSIEKEGE